MKALFSSSQTILLLIAITLVLTAITPANAFLPPYCFVRLPPQRTFPSLSVKEIIKPTTLLRVSSAPQQTVTESIENEDKENKEEEKEEEFDMPFSKFQEWALRDNLPRYVVSIPVQDGSQQQLCALWRTMMREVTELGGYPVEMLKEMHARQLKRKDGDATLSVTPSVLPLLDEFEFEASGGLSGHVYGIPGVADGTRIVTNEVKDVQLTVPKGYVQTKDGAVAYELGTPLRESYSLDAATNQVRDVSSKATNTAAGLAKGAVSNVPVPVGEEDPDTMLVRIGFATAVVLAGATAVNMLSHHLTVNVFWV